MQAKAVVKELLSLLEKQNLDAPVFLQAVSQDALLNAPWTSQVLDVIETREQLAHYPEEFVFRLLDVIPKWPDYVGDYLIALSMSVDNPQSDTAFDLLQRYDDRTQAMRWLAKLAGQSRERQRQCLRAIGDLQRTLETWQSAVWADFLDSAKENVSVNEWTALLTAIGLTGHEQAVIELNKLYVEAAEAGHEYLIESIQNQLDELARAEVKGAIEAIQSLSGD